MKFRDLQGTTYKFYCIFSLIFIFNAALYVNLSFGQTSSQLNNAKELLEKSLALMDDAKFAEANSYLKNAVEIYEITGMPAMAAHCYNHLSSNNRLMSNLKIARRQADHALSLIEDLQLKDEVEKIRAYTNLGLISAIEANYEQSLRHLEKASSLLDDTDVSSGLKIVVLGSLGYLNDDLGKYNRALYYFNNALEILLAQPDPSQFRLAKLYNNIGVAYSNKGLYRQALHYYRLELEMNLLAKGTDHPDVAGTYLNIGNNYFRSGDTGEALLYFQRAYRTILAVYGKKHEMTVLALNSIANCEIKLGNNREAIDYLNSAIIIKKELVGAKHPELAVSYQSIGNAYAALGNWSRTFRFYQKALTLRERSLPPEHPKLADSYNDMAKYYLEKGDSKKALNYLQRAEDILLESVGSKNPNLANIYGAMGTAYSQQGDAADTILMYQKALSIAAPTFHKVNPDENPEPEHTEYPSIAVSVLLNKAKSFRKLHQQSGGQALLKASLSTYMVLSKLLDYRQRGYRQLNSKLALGKRSHETYELAIDTAYRLYKITSNPSYFQLIFYFSEKSRGRVLREVIAGTRTKKFAGIPDTILQKERQLEFKLAEVKKQLNELFHNNVTENDKINRWRDSLFTLNRQMTSFADNLERQFPKYHQLKYSSQFPSVYRIQQRLAEKNTTILEYYYGNESIYAIVITPDRLWVQPLQYNPDLASQISAFTRAIINGADKNYRALGFRLYKMLVKPVEAYLKSADSLLIVPGGPLSMLPFEALLTKKHTSYNSEKLWFFPYLVKYYNISYSTSIALNAAITMKPNTRFEREFIGFAPAFSSNNRRGQKMPGSNRWKALPFSILEIQEISSLFEEEASFWNFFNWFDAPKSTIFINEEATEKRFKNNSSQNARYIHLATHAFAKDGADKRSGIAFYQNNDEVGDNILFTNEIYNLNLHTQLVVLSACKTGVGSIIRGEGIMGLSRAFQYAGANNLLVSFWKIDDRSTASLMVSFYDLLQKEYSMSGALSRSKRIMIETRRYAHPRYWAAFKLIGTGRQ